VDRRDKRVVRNRDEIENENVRKRDREDRMSRKIKK